MGTIFKLSWRNLLRHKRRNLMLGIGIAFGMMVLVLSNAFSYGMVDLIFKDIVSLAYGHVMVEGIQDLNSQPMLRDKAAVEELIRKTIPAEELVDIKEYFGAYGKAIGNREADFVTLIGLFLDHEPDPKSYFTRFFTRVAGDYNDFFNPRYDYPIIISASKAKSLNVKLHDVVWVRLATASGQVQAVPFTIVAVANANNLFLEYAVFMEGKLAKKLLGYQPWEAANLQITLKNPQQKAKYYAGLLYRGLKPKRLAVRGKVADQPCQLIGVKNESAARKILRSNLNIVAGDLTQALGKEGVMLNAGLATRLGLKPNDSFAFQYPTRQGGWQTESLTVTAIFRNNLNLGVEPVLINSEKAFALFNRVHPAYGKAGEVTLTAPWADAVAREFKLLPRSMNSDQLTKIVKAERKIKTKQPRINVATMYEGASYIIQMGDVLNFISGVAVMTLFLIILIGIANTLGMTVQERTREIGTMRAIGMQRREVRNLFLLETLVLTSLACGAGIILAWLLMLALGMVPLNFNGAFNIILRNGHLYFKMDGLGMVINLLFILLMAELTAFFPAGRAAKLLATEALRHH